MRIKFLGSKAVIGTKFFNLIRYNLKIKQPVFYHLKVKNKNGEFVFYKNSSYEEKVGEESIIKENKNVSNIFAVLNLNMKKYFIWQK